ncbi:hypothetical protein [Malikia sp.]|uniref:hypothetical protein n=1 Tax=Malikia sp. TaxID=2070706 RepID=UPI0026028081|nr:hypothetical protein [Malikia sp.]MDD2730141.1 hypothetical protein [Malikia sp.]
MSDTTTKATENVAPRRRASDRQQPEQLAKAATDGNLIQRRRKSDWPTTTKRTVLDGGCVVLAFPGYDLPAVVNRRRGRLPNSIPKLSDERKRRLERQEWARTQALRLAELEGNFCAAGLLIRMLRDGLAEMGYDLDGSPMASKKAGGKA